MSLILKKTLNNERIVFNARLSQARVVSENSSGILAARFGVFQKPIRLEPEKATIITKACRYLHHFLTKETRSTYWPSSEEEITENLILPLQRLVGRNSTTFAKTTRENFCNYFNHEGKI
ncbi:hypothetical protein NQ314_004664 [Rhamnusium bicolor]|uniref:DDE Tnp4 domain-containing protein n=1 Tax=Rhamnusium bicolor TaxID=1586634 RepID=A0AAV8ZIY8_9CUCU|nr:hypothetical protein NQ314_004664 [Rhamnusium bicolor]